MEGCAKVMTYGELEAHERLTCRFRLVPCVNGCAAYVPFIRMSRHTTKDCLERFVQCPLKCGGVLRYQQLAGHVDRDCPRRGGAEAAVAVEGGKGGMGRTSSQTKFNF